MSRDFSARTEVVTELTYGSEIAVAASVGATVLTVDDVNAFLPEDQPGQVTLGGHVYDYLTCDDDASTVTLATGLTATAAVGDRVDLWDPSRSKVAVEYEADLSDDDSDDAGDPLQATVDHALVPLLPTGVRGEASEATLVAEDGDSVRVTGLSGKPPEIGSESLSIPHIDGRLSANETTSTGSSYAPIFWFVTIYGSSTIDYDYSVGEVVLKVAGYYDVFVNGSFDVNSTGARQASIEVDTGDGSGFVQVDVDRRVANSGSKTTVKSIEKNYYPAGTRVRFRFLQNSGGGLDLLVNETRFRVVKIAN